MTHTIRHTARAVLLAALVSTSAAAMAQYQGPSSIPAMTVKQLVDNGQDDQHATLKGRIVSHDGGKNYTFEDTTGRISVEISTKRFPVGQAFDEKREIEITGELDKESNNKLEFEVEQLRVL
jgi:uncharacterized protein (TIGR00156 family)